MDKLKYHYRAFRYRYLIDAPEIRYLLNCLRPGDLAVDIGSHKGGYLYWMRRKVGPEGHVYAFEPQPKLYAYLKDTIGRMGYTNVTLENLGLSDAPGSVDFFIPGGPNSTSPGARIDRLDKQDDYRPMTIEVTTIDQYFLERSRYPRLLKIDVEGHEDRVLAGARHLLEKKPPFLLLEAENRHLTAGDISDVFRPLLELDYRGYFFDGGHRRPLQEFNPAVHQAQGPGRFWAKRGYLNNFVFEPPSLT